MIAYLQVKNIPRGIDVHHPVPVIRSGVENGSERDDARIGNQNVDDPERLDSGCDHRLGICGLGDIAIDLHDLGAPRAKIIRGGTEPRHVDIGDHQPRSFGGEQLRGRSTDAFCCSGDYG